MTGNLELEKTLWAAADKLPNNMDAAEYKYVVLGLIFLKYICDAFDELYQKLKAEKAEIVADPEDKDEYTAEEDNPSLKGVLSKDYARPTLYKQRVDELIDLIGSVVLFPFTGGVSAYGGRGGQRKRSNEILFIDALELGTMMSCKQRELTVDDIAKISETYHN